MSQPTQRKPWKACPEGHRSPPEAKVCMECGVTFSANASAPASTEPDAPAVVQDTVDPIVQAIMARFDAQERTLAEFAQRLDANHGAVAAEQMLNATRASRKRLAEQAVQEAADNPPEATEERFRLPDAPTKKHGLGHGLKKGLSLGLWKGKD